MYELAINYHRVLIMSIFYRDTDKPNTIIYNTISDCHVCFGFTETIKNKNRKNDFTP